MASTGKKKFDVDKKKLYIIGGVVLGIILLFGILYFATDLFAAEEKAPGADGVFGKLANDTWCNKTKRGCSLGGTCATWEYFRDKYGLPDGAEKNDYIIRDSVTDKCEECDDNSTTGDEWCWNITGLVESGVLHHELCPKGCVCAPRSNVSSEDYCKEGTKPILCGDEGGAEGLTQGTASYVCVKTEDCSGSGCECLPMDKDEFKDEYGYGPVACGRNVSQGLENISQIDWTDICDNVNGILSYCYSICSEPGCEALTDKQAKALNATEPCGGGDKAELCGYDNSGNVTPRFCYEVPTLASSEADNSPTDHTADPASINYTRNEMFLLELTAKGERSVLNNITLKADGTGDDSSDVKNVIIYATGSDGEIDEGDPLIGESNSSYPEDNGTLSIDVNYTISMDTTGYLLIIYEMNKDVAAKDTYWFEVANISVERSEKGVVVMVKGLGVKSAVKTIAGELKAVCGDGFVDESAGEECEINNTLLCSEYYDYSADRCNNTVTCGAPDVCTWDTSACICTCDESAKPAPEDWSECKEGEQTRKVAECDTSTGQWRKTGTETRDCETGEGLVWLTWLLIILGGVLLLGGGFFALWYFYLGPNDMLLGSKYDDWFGGGYSSLKTPSPPSGKSSLSKQEGTLAGLESTPKEKKLGVPEKEPKASKELKEPKKSKKPKKLKKKGGKKTPKKSKKKPKKPKKSKEKSKGKPKKSKKPKKSSKGGGGL